jgi:hypothetical protein
MVASATILAMLVMRRAHEDTGFGKDCGSSWQPLSFPMPSPGCSALRVP